MRGQLLADLPNSLDQTRRKVSRAKVPGNAGDDFVPQILARFRMDSLVAENNETLSSRYDEEQHTVPLSRVVNSQTRECPPGSLLNAAPEYRRNRHDNLTRRSTLSLLD